MYYLVLASKSEISSIKLCWMFWVLSLTIGVNCSNVSILQAHIFGAYYFLKRKILLYKNRLNKKINDLTKYNLEFISCRD